ncbi:AraC family transcriptional regulator (plasmid) [Embleya sp. NBC_00888]|uniref:helix-turn-helix transcriptional regulator n=1 Tax=Embleya sp. NBC_00888 TaxID=2975960 RepID=UPI002F90F010|nr:AraC family transcriptional regulator [Embleya sp. NBC_00888]
MRTGRLPCAVDLTECVVDSGSWLWVRPGQVLRLRPSPLAVEGTVVVFQAGFLDAATVAAAHLDRRARRLPLAPEPEAQAPVRDTLEMLASEYHRLGDLPLEVHVDVVRHLLAVLVLRLAHLPGGHRNRAAGDRTFRRFQRAVEEGFTRSHQVEGYAALLGYSVRTLTRATTAAVGVGAKAFIDDRVVLEAKRLLLHTELPAGAIGDRLGFPDASVFTKFFRHRTGETPAAFRARAHGHAT